MSHKEPGLPYLAPAIETQYTQTDPPTPDRRHCTLCGYEIQAKDAQTIDLFGLLVCGDCSPGARALLQASWRAQKERRSFCALCGLDEPCGLRAPGPDGKPDPAAPVVCLFEPTYTELRVDKARLDWLEQIPRRHGWKNWNIDYRGELSMSISETSFRDAVDAAMKAEQS